MGINISLPKTPTVKQAVGSATFGAPAAVATKTGLGGQGGWLDKASKGDFGGALDDLKANFGFSDRDAKAALEQYKASQEAEYQTTSEFNKKMGETDEQYYKRMKNQGLVLQESTSKLSDKYTKDVSGLMAEASNQAKRADATYSSTILPALKDIMERAQTESKSAMSLSEAGDPNNSVAQAVRNLYAQQAGNVRRQGLADVGVLSGMGAQAMGQALGGYGAPVTGSQLQLLQAGTQAQGGAAYARAQQQMQRLREQGLERGFEESSKQYERGVGAKERERSSVGDYEGAAGRREQLAQGFRGERYGYTGDIFGTQMGQAGMNYNIQSGIEGLRAQTTQSDLQRRLATEQAKYGGQQAMASAAAQTANAQQAGKLGALGGLAGTLIGAKMGGAEGAKVGAGVGSSFGGMAPQTGVPQQTNPYGAYQQQPYGAPAYQPFNPYQQRYA